MANNYPVWWTQSITIYNKYENPQTRAITWYRTVLTNCFWKDTDSKIVVGGTTIEADSILCRIPVNDKFKENYEWKNLADNVRSNYFTFSVGDIVVRGIVNDTINEYTNGSRSSDLLKKYKSQGCMTVNRCSVNTGVGRGNEHYYVKGV